jgi:transcription antitermination factor NusG
VTQRRRDRITLSAKSTKPLAPGERRETVTKVPAPDLDLTPPWFLLMTAPRAEERVSAKLMEAGCQVFWPHEFHRVEYGGKRKPLEFRRGTYPGYLLMAGELRGLSSIFDVDGVTSVVGTSSGWATIPAGVVKAMAAYQNDELPPHLEIVPSEVDPPNTIHSGQPVRILAGPFMAFMATMVESIGMERAKVAIDIMGRETFVEIDVEQLEAA